MFKVGDEVRVIKRVGNIWILPMDKTINEVGRIKYIENKSGKLEVSFRDGIIWWYEKESLELVEEKKEEENNMISKCPCCGMHNGGHLSGCELIKYVENNKESLELVEEKTKIEDVFVAGGNEICICAAVRAEDGNIIRGQAHRDCRDGIIRRGKKPSKRWEDEGFITSTGRFVNREQGFELMQIIGWKSMNPQGYQKCGWLYSEDLY